jgi:hypothetical protein
MSFEISNAQKIELGCEIGYGKTYITDQIYFGQLFETTDIRDITADINASYKLDTIALWLTMGISYQQMWDNNKPMNFLKLPLGIDITPGKKVKFIIGSGVYLRYIFSVPGSAGDDYNHTMHDFQIGLYVDTGVKYQINDTWNIYLKMQADIDLSTLYTEANPNHSGGYDYQDLRTYCYSFNIGCKYVIR